MAVTPNKQLKQLAIGTVISAISMIVMTLTSDLENRWLFYFLVSINILAIIYAIPGYIGMWVWRMRKVLFDID